MDPIILADNSGVAAGAPAGPATPTEPAAGAAPQVSDTTNPAAAAGTDPAAGSGTPAAPAVPAVNPQIVSQRINAGVDKFVAGLNLVNQVTGMPITNKAEFDQAAADIKAANEARTFHETTGIDPQAISPLVESLITNHPLFKAFEQQQAESARETQLGDFSKEFPTVKLDRSRADFGLPNAPDIEKYMRAGNNLVDAYYLANRSKITTQLQGAAQQDAVSQIMGVGASSPGALSGADGQQVKDYSDMKQADFDAIVQKALSGELKKI